MSELTPTPLTIVGAGPAGIMAAYTAAMAGVDVTIIDNNPQPGGQYYRQSPPEFNFPNMIDSISSRVDGPEVLSKLANKKIRTFYSAQVWGVHEGNKLLFADEKQSYILPTDQVIIATGAYDRPMAFPGWTLPGVLGAGATLRMVKTQWVLPGKRVLLAGTGPLQLALADLLLKKGAEVVCIAEAANPFTKPGQLPNFWGNWDRLIEGLQYFSTLFKHKVKTYYDHAIIKATGSDHVERATIAKLDKNGDPIPGTEKEYEVDAVCLGYGLIPAFQLAASFNCQLSFDPRINWFTPKHDQTMATTTPNVFVAGDLTAIAGSKAALLEGEIAGLNAIHKLGAITDQELSERSSKVSKKLKKINRLANALQVLYKIRPELSKLAKDDTLICRCEEVPLSSIKEAIANGGADLHQVKLATRSGMGYCQGRFCSALVAPLIAEATGTPLSEMVPFTVRSPIHPLTMEMLASGFNPETEVENEPAKAE